MALGTHLLRLVLPGPYGRWLTGLLLLVLLGLRHRRRKSA